MTNEEMMSRLYGQMVTEQLKYKEWLLGQPPGVILDNAYQFAAVSYTHLAPYNGC